MPTPNPTVTSRGPWHAMGTAVAGVLVGGLAVYAGSLHRPERSLSAEAGSAAQTPAFADVAAAARSSVVSLEVGDEVGTGVIIDARGLVITNAWVVAAALPVEARIPVRARVFGRAWQEASVVLVDIVEDLAVVRLPEIADASGYPVAAWGSSANLRLGEGLLAFSNPTGLPYSLMRAVVAAPMRRDAVDTVPGPLIQLDASNSLGGYGGPLFDEGGTLVGLVTVGRVHAQGVAFAIPSDHVQAFLGAASDATAGRAGSLGVPLDPRPVASADRADRGPLVGIRVREGAAASREHELHAGDVIVALDGEPLDTGSAGRLDERIAAHYPGEEVLVSVLRNGKTLELKIRLVARSEREQTELDAATLLGITLDGSSPVPIISGVSRGTGFERYENALAGTRIAAWNGTAVEHWDDLAARLWELRGRVRGGSGPATVTLGILDGSGHGLELPLRVEAGRRATLAAADPFTRSE